MRHGDCFDQRSPKETAKHSQSLRKCAACGATDHSIWHCQEFVKDSLNTRRTFVKQKRLCFNCLGIGHSVKDCSRKARCRTCAKMDHLLLHPSSDQLSTCYESQKQVKTREDLSHTTISLSMSTSTSTDIRHVANISQVKGARNRFQVLPVSMVNPSTGVAKESWALLDIGADTHLLSRRLYSELGLEGQPVWSRLQLANGDLKTFHTHETSCVVQEVDENRSFQLEAVQIVDQLPDLSDSIPTTSDALLHEHLAGLEFPNIAGDEVELLIGTGTPELYIFSDVRRGCKAGLWAEKTPLGLVLFGHEYNYLNVNDKINHISLTASHKLDPISNAICPCQFEHSDLFTDSDVNLPSIDDEKAMKVMKTSCKLHVNYSMRLP